MQKLFVSQLLFGPSTLLLPLADVELPFRQLLAADVLQPMLAEICGALATTICRHIIFRRCSRV